MKKIMFILFALLLSSSVFAQNGSIETSTFKAGWTFSAWSATGSNYGSDSLYYVGRILMRDGYDALDSLGFVLAYSDSLRFQIIVRAGVIVDGTVRASDTATVYIGENVAKYYHQVVAAGISVIPWLNILAATGGEAQHAQFIDVYIRVWHVGTEVQKTLRKMTLFPKAYK